MEIGVRKEYVITTKGTPLCSHCQVWGEGSGWGLGKVDRKKNAWIVVVGSTSDRLDASSEKPSAVRQDLQILYSFSFPCLKIKKTACVFPASHHGNFRFFYHTHYTWGLKNLILKPKEETVLFGSSIALFEDSTKRIQNFRRTMDRKLTRPKLWWQKYWNGSKDISRKETNTHLTHEVPVLGSVNSLISLRVAFMSRKFLTKFGSGTELTQIVPYPAAN
jgi:hypothetical protein